MKAKRLIALALVTVFLTQGVALAANPQPDPPASPAVVEEFEALKAYISNSSSVGPASRRSLVGKLDSAEQRYVDGKPCLAANGIQAYLNEAKTLNSPAAEDLASRGWNLRFSLIAHLPQGMACGTGIQWSVDPSVRPVHPPRKNPNGGPPRPVGRVLDNNGHGVDFVEQELLVAGPPTVALAIAQRYGGGVIDTKTASPGMPVTAVTHIKIDAQRAGLAGLQANLESLSPDVQMLLKFSSADAAGTIAAAAAEIVAGTTVDFIWLPNGSDNPEPLAGGFAAEAPAGPDGFGPQAADTYEPNPYDWSHLTNRWPSVQRIGVPQAWDWILRAGRLDTRVNVRVHDGGFDTNPDLRNAGVDFDNHQPNDGTCGQDGAICKWHGTNVMSTLGAYVNDGYGGAGSAGPIDLRMLGTDYDQDADVIGDLLDNRFSADVDIINMSYGSPIPAALSPFTEAYRGLVTWHGEYALVVAAAGNEGESVDAEDCFGVCWEEAAWLPCEAGNTLCVGGIGHRSLEDDVSSNYGDEDVDIFAPFTVLVGPDPDATANATRSKSGTSFSAPLTAGVAALVVAASGRTLVDPDALRAHLMNTAQSGTGWARRVVDAERAVRSVLPTLINITTPQNGARFPRGVSISFQSFVNDRENSGSPTILWSSHRDGTLGQGPGINYNRLSYGLHRITATATFPNGTQVSDSILVTIDNTPPSVNIIEPADDATEVPLNGTLFVRGDGTDINEVEQNGKLRNDQLRWFVDGAGPKLNDRSGFISLAGIPAGQHTLTLAGTDGTYTAEASRRFTITTTEAQAPTVTITQPADGAEFSPQGPATERPGEFYRDITLAGQATDPQEGALGPGSFVWTVSVNGGAETQFAAGVAQPTYRMYTRNMGSRSTYRFTLSATDSQGNHGSDSITTAIVVLF